MDLVIKNIKKFYSKDILALDDISIEFHQGVYGLLGPNGAGKSTLMKIISTILKPDSGTITLDGHDIINNPYILREVLGYLPQDFGLYPNLNAIEFLSYISCLKGIDVRKSKNRINEVLEFVNLNNVRKKPLRTYSGGMKQRLGIAQALICNPKIIIFDEPTVGLDPEERINFHNMILSLSSKCLIILSTHIVSDLENIASEIIILNKGKLVKNLYQDLLLKSVKGKIWEATMPLSEYQFIRNKYCIYNSTITDDGVNFRVISNDEPVFNSKNISPKLEDAYMFYIHKDKVI